MNLGNFLVSSDFLVRVSDFGTAKIIKDTQAKNTVHPGAPYYASPEMETGKYGFPCDVWSFGIVAAEICGKNDFAEPNRKQRELNEYIADLQPGDANEADLLVHDCGVKTVLTYLENRASALETVKAKGDSQLHKMVTECLHVKPDSRCQFINILAELHAIDGIIGDVEKPNVNYFINKWK